MRRGLLSATEIHQAELQNRGSRYRAAFITATYAQDDAWSPRHITELLQCYRAWLSRRGVTDFRYAWVLELTRRGRPHYHLVIFLPRGLTPPLPDKQGWWKHGLTQAQWARNPVAYLAKYASKGSAGGLPPGARIWGAGGLRGHAAELWRYWRAPTWLRAMASPGDVLRRVGGWWQNRTLKISYRSPWALETAFGDGGRRFYWRGWTEEDVLFNAG